MDGGTQVTNQHKQPGGARQLLARASGLCSFCTTRRSDPQVPRTARRHSTNPLPDLETHVSTPSRPRAAATDPKLLQHAASAHRTRRQYRDFLDAAERYLREQPSARTVRSAGLHLHHGLTALVNDIAGGMPC